MRFCPSYSIVKHAGSSPQRTAFILHGILGHQRNWRTFARRWVQALPNWRILLIDQRNHGDSHGAPAPHTVASTAHDLHTLAEQEGLPNAVLGHSFGGKVALTYACQATSPPQQVWMLDTRPGTNSPATRAQMAHIFDALHDVALPATSRQAVLEELTDRGFPTGMAAWLSTNLRKRQGDLAWVFDLPGVRSMLSDYFDLDLWAVLSAPPCDVHVLHAERNQRWTQSDLDRLDHAGERVHRHRLTDSDHWVHVDNPDGLLQLLIAHIGVI